MDLYKVRKDIVEFLYRFSANQYPAICKQLGLADGTVEEAFKSKRNFMYSRLIPLKQEEIVDVLKNIKENYNSSLIPEENFNYVLSTITRRDIINALINGFDLGNPIIDEIVHISWNGCLSELDFIKRICDISKIKVIDTRCESFEDEFYRHRVYNDDYEDNYFFVDERLPMANADDATFLNIICQIIHPEVRCENSCWKVFKDLVSKLISEDGFELYVSGKISGREVYNWRKIMYFDDSFEIQNTKHIEVIFDSKYLNQQIDLMKKTINTNPTVSIGKAKELLESCYKYIGNKRNIDLNKNDNLMQMDKKIRKVLSFDVTDDNKEIPGFAMLCSGLGNIVHGISELRNNYGDGHGKDISSFTPLASSYAGLIVNTSINYVSFLLEVEKCNK